MFFHLVVAAKTSRKATWNEFLQGNLQQKQDKSIYNIPVTDTGQEYQIYAYNKMKYNSNMVVLNGGRHIKTC